MYVEEVDRSSCLDVVYRDMICSVVDDGLCCYGITRSCLIHWEEKYVYIYFLVHILSQKPRTP
jgi:hypothetical protein